MQQVIFKEQELDKTFPNPDLFKVKVKHLLCGWSIFILMSPIFNYSSFLVCVCMGGGGRQAWLLVEISTFPITKLIVGKNRS